MNIDWLNILVGILVGWLFGFASDRLILWSRHVKVEFLGFVPVQTNFGTLYKMRFQLKGHENPGECSCEIKANDYTTFAKWDETPNPLREDRLSDFAPELVPMTFRQRLHIGREYCVPLLVKVENGVFVFDGWWFGRGAGYYNQPSLRPRNVLSVSVQGSSFVWSHTFTFEEVVNI